MKIVLTIMSLLISSSLYAGNSRQIDCKGLTYDGDTYYVKANFWMKDKNLERATPYTVVGEKKVPVDLWIVRDDVVIHKDRVHMEYMRYDARSYSDTFRFSKYENNRVSDYLNVVLNDNGSEIFNFSLNGVSGKFKNGNCETSNL